MYCVRQDTCYNNFIVLAVFICHTSGKPVLCTEFFCGTEISVQLILKSCMGVLDVLWVCACYTKEDLCMLHYTKQQVFRPSACKQTAVGVYRTLIVQLTQAGLCVTFWLKCNMHKATTHPSGRYPTLPQTFEFLI